MRMYVLSAALLAGLNGAAALAQQTPVARGTVPPGTVPGTGALPGNPIGTGASLPMSNQASNIVPQDTQGTVASNLPSPNLGPSARPSDYLRAAQSALAAGRTGETQQALEMAQTRLLDRSVPLGQTNRPHENPTVQQISQGLNALGVGDRARNMQMIQAALSSAVAQSN